MKKLTYEFVKKKFENEGYELLSKEYVNVHHKLCYICPNGHFHSITWNNWKMGYRCAHCAGNARLSIDHIREEFKSEEYILLSKEYRNCSQKLEYICPQGHKYIITWNNWKQGARCAICANVVKLSFNYIKTLFENEGYVLLTNKYVNSRQKLQYSCSYGHKHSVMLSDWKYHGSRCPTCAYIKKSGAGHPNWKGGISCEPYCDAWADKEYKESIKERDNYQCQNPYCFKKQGLASQLSIHHIDYDKKNCGPDNLITLCNSCNSRANFDRQWHKHWYQIIMNKKYNYNY